MSKSREQNYKVKAILPVLISVCILLYDSAVKNCSHVLIPSMHLLCVTDLAEHIRPSDRRLRCRRSQTTRLWRPDGRRRSSRGRRAVRLPERGRHSHTWPPDPDPESHGCRSPEPPVRRKQHRFTVMFQRHWSQSETKSLPSVWFPLRLSRTPGWDPWILRLSDRRDQRSHRAPRYSLKHRCRETPSEPHTHDPAALRKTARQSSGETLAFKYF